MSEKHTDRPVFNTDAAERRARTIALIGGTSGIGRAAVTQLESAGHRLIVVGRDTTKGGRLVGERVEFVAADISRLDGMRHAAEQIRRRAGRLDVLINNAGVMRPVRELTADGFEMNFAVHHLAPFVLTGELFESLVPGGRVVNVNSAGHRAALRSPEPVRIHLDDLRFDRGYEPSLAYSRSKFANLMFGYELHRRYGDRLTVNALHPGTVRTELGRDFPRAMVAGIQLVSGAISPARGARPVVRLAVSPEAGRAGGRYFDRFTEVRSSEASYDQRMWARLWERTEQLVGPFLPSGKGPATDHHDTAGRKGAA